ncbi:MAG: 1-deoxy-D-xylulose-5-phosphate reductoisomerase [Puniceicoccales bacterium]|jgi:1-deoxy-D-xylulose-5-phosphate reductoisomerase|nr:1-deoxy-D-xylulose-5-phosphate reductoisomerase [Puniceicoccales bacterium]
MDGRRSVVLLGASGSVGGTVLELLRRNREQFHLLGLSVHRNLAAAERMIGEFSPKFLAVTGLSEKEFPKRLPVRHLPICELAGLEEADYVVVAVPGPAALRPLLAAIAADRRIILANKESIVTAGAIVRDALFRSRALLLPADSEHCGIFQCLSGEVNFRGVFRRSESLRKVWLTASGGPFWDWDRERLGRASAGEALRHPNWSMGARISVDSATLANKGMEEIEAGWLYGLLPEEIGVLVHRRCLVHGIVEFCDGSLLAQISPTSMAFPLTYCLHYPHRRPTGERPLDLQFFSEWNFCSPDRERFPCLAIAEEAFRRGQSAPCDFEAADRVAVEAFLSKKIGFGAIPQLIEEVLVRRAPVPLVDPDAVEARQEEVQRLAQRLLKNFAHRC